MAGGGRADRWRSLCHQVRTFRPDVVVAHSALPNVYARLAAPTGVPVVTVLHSATDDHHNRVLRIAERVLGRRTAHVIAVSRVQAEVYLTHFPRRSPRTTVIPNGVRAELVPATARPVARTIGVLARVDMQKRPDPGGRGDGPALGRTSAVNVSHPIRGCCFLGVRCAGRPGCLLPCSRPRGNVNVSARGSRVRSACGLLRSGS